MEILLSLAPFQIPPGPLFSKGEVSDELLRANMLWNQLLTLV